MTVKKWIKKNSKVAIFFAFLFMLLPFGASANQVLIKPVVTGWGISSGYKMGPLYSVSYFKNFADFQAPTEAFWDERHRECKAQAAARNEQYDMELPYTCLNIQISGLSPRAGSEVNGEPTIFDITGTLIRDSNVEGIGDLPLEGGVAVKQVSCPEGFAKQQFANSQGGSDVFCKSTFLAESPNACESADFGNPISALTGSKHQREVDYLSANSLLTVERNYINQRTGWALTGVSRLYDLNRAPHERSCEYTGTIKYSTYDTSSETAKDVTEIICTQYVSGTTGYSVHLTLANGGVVRFKRAESNLFIADKPGNGRLQSVTSGSDNVVWEYTKSNGEKQFFNSEGLLIKHKENNGRQISYQYTNDRLSKIIDDSGRFIEYLYNENNQISTVTLPDGSAIQYEYHGQLLKNALTKVTWPDGTSKHYLYNETGLVDAAKIDKLIALTGILDENGHRVGTYRYNSMGYAISTESALGTNKFTFSGFNTSTSVTDPSGSLRTLNFQTLPNGAKVLASTSQPAGSGCAASSESISYYGDGLKKSETNFSGHKTQFAYDHSRGRETVRVEGILKTDYNNYLPQGTALAAGVRKLSTQWHSTQHKKIKIAAPNIITRFIYNGEVDPFDNQVATCAPTDIFVLCRQVQEATTDNNGALGFAATLDNALANREWLHTYNERGQMLTLRRSSIAAPEFSIEYYDTTTYDWTKGDRKSLRNALGHVIHFDRYDLNGRLLQMTHANGVVTQFTYDARGRLTSQSVNADTTTHTYDLNGNRIGSVLPNDVAVTYHYDAAKRLTAIENAAGDKINYEYDVENNLRFERITNSSGAITYMKEHVYDALSRLQNVIDSEAQSTTYLYDASGNLTGEQDAKQQTTNHVFDALNQPKQTTDALNGKTDFSYDVRGNLTQVNDAKGLVTAYSYNAFGDLIQQASPDTGTMTFAYDNAGNRTRATDNRGVVVNYIYDALNRLKQVQYPASPSENVTYEYDARTTTNRGIGKLTRLSKTGFAMSYLFNHQGLVTQKTTNVAGLVRATKYAYDRAGQLTSVTYPSGRIVSYSYDGVGRVASVKTKVGSGATTTLVNNINYLPFGPAVSYTYGNGLNLTQNYDQDYRLNAIDVGGSKAIVDRDYAYDPVNNITGITNHLDTRKSQSYDYDPLNRLTAASGVYGLLGYTYDAVGNRLSQHHDDGSQTYNDTYTYASNSHRLLGISRSTNNQTGSTRNFTYDAAGNRLTGKTEDGKTQSYSYNKANRLSSVSVNNTATASYVYNPLGQRVSKTVGSSKEIYFYDEAGQLLSVTTGSGTILREYIYLDSQQVAFISNGTLYYIHNDHLSTPQVVTDQHQQVVWMADYQPFGKLVGTQTNRIELYSRFPGQYLDSETGLYYNYFRDYDPSIGRYIQSDPIGLNGGINTYAYGAANPVKHFDPNGLSVVVKGGVAVIVGGIVLALAYDSGQNALNSATGTQSKTKESKCQIFYRGDDPGKVEFFAHEPGRWGQEMLNNSSRDELMQNHTMDSRNSPYISLTTNIAVANYFAGATGETYQISLPVGKAFPNPHNQLSIPGSSTPESEWLTPLHIPAYNVNNPNCTCE